MAGEKKTRKKKIKATGEMQRIMAEYFYELDDAAKTGRKKNCLVYKRGAVNC